MALFNRYSTAIVAFKNILETLFCTKTAKFISHIVDINDVQSDESAKKVNNKKKTNRLKKTTTKQTDKTTNLQLTDP